MSCMIAYCPQCGHILKDSMAEDIKDYRITRCRFCGFDKGFVKLPEQYTFSMFIKEQMAYVGELAITGDPVLKRPMAEKNHLTDLMTLGIDKNPLYNEELSIKTAYMELREVEKIQQTPKFQEENRQLMEKLRSESKPHCPTCGSTNIKKLDVVDRAVSVGVFGIFSNKINKSFKCKNCGHTW